MNKAVRFFVAAILLASSLTCAPRDDGGGTKGPPVSVPGPETSTLNVPAGLKARIDATVEHVKSRDLLTTHGFWTIFHGILGNGLDTTLLDTSTGKKVNAIEFIRNGGPLRGMQFNPSS